MYRYYKIKKLKILLDFKLKYFSFVFGKKRILFISFLEGFSIGFFDKTYL